MSSSSIINGLWIMKETGETLYNQKTQSSIDSNLFTGYMSAIMTFVKQAGFDSMDMLKIGEITFIITKERDLIFIGQTDINIKEEKIRKMLHKIRSKFLELFDLDLKEWNGQYDIFESFSDILDLTSDEDNIIQKFKDLKW